MIQDTKQKVLVTGSSGFIGKNLVPELGEKGYEVVTLSRHDSDINLDLTTDDLTPLDEHEFDYVVHLAAVSSIKLSKGHEEETIEINLDGTKKLLKYFSTNSARKRSGPRTKKNAPKGATNPLKKFIFLSSITIYECEHSGEITEENALVGDEGNAYSCSKILAEKEIAKHDIPSVILRLANAYGPQQRVGKVPNFIPQVINQALKGHIEIYNGQFARDFIYISDIVSAIIAGMESNYTGTLNLGTGQPAKVGQIANIVAKELKVDVRDLKRKIDEPLELIPNITLIKEKLNWEPKVSLEEGLKKTIEYYANRKNL